MFFERYMQSLKREKMKKTLSMGLVISAMLLFVGCGGGSDDGSGTGEVKEVTTDAGVTIDVSQLTQKKDIWIVKNVNQAGIDEITRYAKAQLDPNAVILVENLSCNQLGRYALLETEILSGGAITTATGIEASRYYYQNSGLSDNEFYCKEYALPSDATNDQNNINLSGNLTVAIGGWNNGLDQSLHNGYFGNTTSSTSTTANANVIELIPNDANVEINANNPIDVNSSMVVSQDQQTMVLPKDTSISVDSPLFLDGVYQGMIAFAENNTDDTITVTLRNAADLAEIIDTLSINFDTSEGTINSNISGSPKQKLTSENISLYDSKNTKQMSYTLRNAKTIAGNNEPILRIDIPADYNVPVPAQNSKIICSLLDASCTGDFTYEESSGINLGETTTTNGLTFSTEGSYVEIGLGMYLDLFADINRFSDDILQFKFKESAYFKSNLQATISGTLSADWQKTIPLTNPITVNIPIYGKIVTAKVVLQPYIIVGANGKLGGSVEILSSTLRKGDMTFAFDSQLDTANKLQTEQTIAFDATAIDKNEINSHMTANGSVFSTAGIQMTPTIFLTNVLDIDIGDIRGGIHADTNVVGNFGVLNGSFDIWNGDYSEAMSTVDGMVQLTVETYPKIDYKLNIGIDPIGLDPISFYSQSEYNPLYQGPVTNVFDWKMPVLPKPTIIETIHNPLTWETAVKFDIDVDPSIKKYVKFYYSKASTESNISVHDQYVNNGNSLWDGQPIIISEGTSFSIHAKLNNADYSTSAFAFGTSENGDELSAHISLCNKEYEELIEGVCYRSYTQSKTPYVLVEVNDHVDSTIEGTVTEYDENGTITKTTPYVRNIIVDENGTSIGVDRSLEHGTAYGYNPDGTISWYQAYIYGIAQGIIYP